ncbi:MAG TPA: hypothetical protein VEA63_15835, partial [Opitutus sp.]|nr:hypothetical protein [Opitutus sp.]
MIRNASILLCVALALLTTGRAAAAPAAPVVDLSIEETADLIRVSHAGGELVVERVPWRLRLNGADRAERFNEAAPPALQIAGVWQPVKEVTGVRRNGDA